VAQPNPVIAGRLLTYTLTATNEGSTPATGVVVTDTLPADTTYQSCSGATCGQAANKVTWTVGTLGANSQATLTLVVRVLPAIQAGTPIENLNYEVDSVQTNPVQGPPVIVRVANLQWFPVFRK
jgi:uncharacterized repeat protein (TIGR01451 family)